jgi:hypothetical protein
MLLEVSLFSFRIWQQKLTFSNDYNFYVTALWSSGQSSWLQIQRSRVRFPGTTRKKKGVGLERGPLSLGARFSKWHIEGKMASLWNCTVNFVLFQCDGTGLLSPIINTSCIIFELIYGVNRSLWTDLEAQWLFTTCIYRKKISKPWTKDLYTFGIQTIHINCRLP